MVKIITYINNPADLSPAHDYDKISLSPQCRVFFSMPNGLLFFLKKICLVNPYRVLCPKTSRIRTSLFSSSQICKGLSSEGQDVFVMTFPTPLLTSHIHP